MERVLAPVFVVIALGAGLSLDFWSARRVNPGLTPKDYASLRLGSVLGAGDKAGDASPTEAVAAAPADGKAPSAFAALSLAAGAIAGLSGRGASAADAAQVTLAPGTIDPGASPADMQKQAAAAFAQVAIAIAAGDKGAIMTAAAPATPAAPPAPPPSLIQPVKRLVSGSCAGTRFCSVGN